MKTIDKIIFDELAGRRSVVLPGIGTLGVERRAAVLKNRRTLEAPYNLVTFSRKEIASVLSVVDLLTNEGVDVETAQQTYEQWLQQARVGTSVKVEEAGALESGFFKVAEPLNVLLNPGYEKVVRLKPLHRFRAVWIGAVVVILLLGVAGYYGYVYYYDGNQSPKSGKEIPMSLSEEPVKESVLVDSMRTENPVDDSSEVREPAATLSSETLTTPAEAAGAVSGYQYYVVAGVYSTEENADKAIAKLRSADATVMCEKVPFAGGKIMISLYSSGDEAQVSRERSRLARQLGNSDLWVYKKRINR